MVWDVLDESGRAVLTTIGQQPWARDYYLAGGTGLALHLGHRKSQDLDFFGLLPSEGLPGDLEENVLKAFGPYRAHVFLRQFDQMNWAVDGTKVSFIAYPFPLMYPLVPLDGANLAHPREIALMKAYTVGRRATARDYIDLYFVLRGAIMSVDDMILEARRKFLLNGEPQFSPRLFLSQLVYTKDVEAKNTAAQLIREEGVSFAAVEEFLAAEARRYVRDTLGKTPGEKEER